MRGAHLVEEDERADHRARLVGKVRWTLNPPRSWVTGWRIPGTDRRSLTPESRSFPRRPRLDRERVDALAQQSASAALTAAGGRSGSCPRSGPTISTVKWLSPRSSWPAWPRWLSLSSRTSKCAGASASVRRGDFGGDRAGFKIGHPLYIMGLDGKGSRLASRVKGRPGFMVGSRDTSMIARIRAVLSRANSARRRPAGARRASTVPATGAGCASTMSASSTSAIISSPA